MTHQEEARGERSQAGETRDFRGDRTHYGVSENHRQLWDRLQESNGRWLERFQNEATLAVEYASKLSAARTPADAADAFQRWTLRHIELASEDSRRAMADVQHMWEAGARIWSDFTGEAGRVRGMMS